MFSHPTTPKKINKIKQNMLYGEINIDQIIFCTVEIMNFLTCSYGCSCSVLNLFVLHSARQQLGWWAWFRKTLCSISSHGIKLKCDKTLPIFTQILPSFPIKNEKLLLVMSSKKPFFHYHINTTSSSDLYLCVNSIPKYCCCVHHTYTTLETSNQSWACCHVIGMPDLSCVCPNCPQVGWRHV